MMSDIGVAHQQTIFMLGCLFCVGLLVVVADLQFSLSRLGVEQIHIVQTE